MGNPLDALMPQLAGGGPQLAQTIMSAGFLPAGMRVGMAASALQPAPSMPDPVVPPPPPAPIEPTPLPTLKPPAEMPVPLADAAGLAAVRRREISALRARSGRLSTILTPGGLGVNRNERLG